MILLSFACALTEDIAITPSELVHRTTLRLPGDFYDPSVNNFYDSSVKINYPRLYIKKFEYKSKTKRDIIT